jgi:hypothetical protein
MPGPRLRELVFAAKEGAQNHRNDPHCSEVPFGAPRSSPCPRVPRGLRRRERFHFFQTRHPEQAELGRRAGPSDAKEFAASSDARESDRGASGKAYEVSSGPERATDAQTPAACGEWPPRRSVLQVPRQGKDQICKARKGSSRGDGTRRSPPFQAKGRTSVVHFA